MSLRVASWNIEGRLSPFSTSGRGTPDKILDEIEQLNADVIFLPEAYDGEKDISQPVEAKITRLGYRYVHDVDYENSGPQRRTDDAVKQPYLRMMSKLAFQKIRNVRLGNLRNAIDAVVHDPESGLPVRIIGVHLDDRNEDLRLRQVESLEDIIAKSDIPLVVMGDMNAMYGDSHRAALLRSAPVKLAAHAFPIETLSDFGTRATEMATGTTMARLTTPGMLIDADSSHQPTSTPRVRGFEIFPSVRLIGIDHILASPALETSEFQVGKHDSGSDHRPISVTISHSSHLQK